MPQRPKRLRLTNPTRRKAWGDDRLRGNRHQRGYDNDWVKLRNAYKAQHPLCERCEARGVIKEMDEVNHKQPFDGIDDPLRLDWDNLESLCTPCHLRVTGRRKKKR